jgi:hypothetical protein
MSYRLDVDLKLLFWVEVSIDPRNQQDIIILLRQKQTLKQGILHRIVI